MERRGYKIQEFVAHASDVNCLSFGKKSNRVFITGGEDRTVNLWAICKPTPLLSSSGHTSSVDSVAFDSAEVLVLAGSSNGTVKLWDLEKAKNLTLPTGTPAKAKREDQGRQKKKGLASVDEDIFPEMSIQNHDVFINAVKSRLTKLQHFFEQIGIKVAINAVAKLPDHYVQADVICILKENIELLNLEIFSCLLPIIAGLVSSKMERHISVSLEMLLELANFLGPVIHSTVTATSIVGVDLQAEQRWEHCNCCFNHLQKIKKTVLPLIRKKRRYPSKAC